jgi:hypothetical protein
VATTPRRLSPPGRDSQGRDREFRFSVALVIPATSRFPPSRFFCCWWSSAILETGTSDWTILSPFCSKQKNVSKRMNRQVTSTWPRSSKKLLALRLSPLHNIVSDLPGAVVCCRLATHDHAKRRGKAGGRPAGRGRCNGDGVYRTRAYQAGEAGELAMTR